MRRKPQRKWKVFKGKLMHGQQHPSYSVINIPAGGERARAD